MALLPSDDAYQRYWGPILAAVEERADTATIYQVVRDEVAKSGQPAPPGMFHAVTQIRSAAVQYRQAGVLMAKAADDATVDSRLAPQAIWSRDLGDQAISPKIQVVFQLTHQLPGQESVTEWRTAYDIDWTPDMTVGELRDAVQEAAEAMSMRTATGVGGTPTGAVVSVADLTAVAY